MKCSYPLRRPSVGTTVLLAAVLLAGLAGVAAADTQRLQLQPGWNLVALSVEPVDPSPAVIFASLGANLQSVWAYDNAMGSWGRFPQPAVGAPTVDALRSGRGYWVQVASSANVDIDGVDGALPAGPDDLVAGWNLVGFPLLANAAYDRVLANAAVREVWGFDNRDGFEGVVIDAAGLAIREDFINLEPGRGYWVRSTGDTSVASVLRTTLPGDVDVPPLIDGDPPVDQPVPWTSLSQGDVDYGRDDFYDRPLTQRTVVFGARAVQQRMVLANGGAGVLRFRVTVDDPESCQWLRFESRDLVDGTVDLVTEVSGGLATERFFLNLIAVRGSLPAGDYECGFSVASNGSLPVIGRLADGSRLATEPARNYNALMTVGGIEGDYRLTVQLETVNGQPADLAAPRLTLSLYEDAGGLKSIVDPARTLLLSTDLHLSGRLIEAGTTRFEVNGSFEMPPAMDGNPFSAPVRRDITLRGMRTSPGGQGGTLLGSRELEGTYFETLRNLNDEPIQLVGSFVGERLSAAANIRDAETGIDSTSVGLPDDGVLERSIMIDDRLLVDEVDVTTNITHDRPADLVVKIRSPTGTEVLLRNRSAANVGTQIFDELNDPVESLELFEGELATGLWTLSVADEVAGVTGNLLAWELDVRGTRVRDVQTSVCSDLPVGSTVLLAGCGRTEVGLAAADRTVVFEDLIDCVYTAQVAENGFERESRSVVLSGPSTDAFVVPEFCPLPATPVVPMPIVLPQSPQGVFTSLTTRGGAGLAGRADPFLATEQQYGLDSATWDLNRQPLDPNTPGLEDTNAFLDVIDAPLPPQISTGSNAVGPNGTLDGPVGDNSFRVQVTLGMPVIGRSVQGDLTLEVGANP